MGADGTVDPMSVTLSSSLKKDSPREHPEHISFGGSEEVLRINSMNSSTSSSMEMAPERSSPIQELLGQRRSTRDRFEWNKSEVSDRTTCPVDVMLVFPRGEQPGDDVVLPAAGSDQSSPAAYSVQWYLKQTIADDHVFKTDQRRTLYRGEHLIQTAFMAEEEEEEETQKPTASLGPSNASAQDEEPMPARRKGKKPTVGGPHVNDLFDKVEASKTFGELRENMISLIIGYVLCKHCGFEARVFTSADGKDLFVGIAAREAVLRAHADLLSYRLKLSQQVAVDLLCAGHKGPPLFTDREIVPPFIEYDVDEEEQYKLKFGSTPFHVNHDAYRNGTIFFGVDRIRIISTVLRKVFNMDGMKEMGMWRQWYPCHAQDRLNHISGSWVLPQKLFPEQHVNGDDIASYFGEKIGFRICFLRHLNINIFLMAIVMPFMLVFVDKHLARMIVGGMLVVWSATMEEFWKRREVKKVVEWGMEEHKEGVRKRPQFQGEWTRSEVDRISLNVKTYPWHKTMLRRTLTWTITLLYQVSMVSVTLMLYEKHDELLADGLSTWALGVNCAISLQMKICDAFWDYLGQKLGNFDNYDSDTMYNDALLQRTFGVRFIVSFASLFYIAFIKNLTVGCIGAGGTSGEGNCIALVATQLRTLILTNMFFHMLSVIIPYAQFRCSVAKERYMAPAADEGYVPLKVSPLREGTEETPRDSPRREDTSMSILTESMFAGVSGSSLPSFPETQAKMPEYTLAEEVYDVMDVIVELGYVLFFGFVAPEVITLFFISNIFRLHAIGWKLVYTMQRPFPHGAAGLGVVFGRVFHVMSRCAVACNIVLVLITNSSEDVNHDAFAWLKEFLSTPATGTDRVRDWKSMLIVFFVMDACISVLRTLIDLAIPDIPYAVELLQQRSKAIHVQLVRNATSELKVWEGRELERAYEEARMNTKWPQVLRPNADGVNEWQAERSAVANVVRGTGAVNVLPWKPEDPHFESPWFLQFAQRAESDDPALTLRVAPRDSSREISDLRVM